MRGIRAEAERRRTFAVISHPDAGKITLTEKLLVFSGAIQEAGAVEARAGRQRAPEPTPFRLARLARPGDMETPETIRDVVVARRANGDQLALFASPTGWKPW